MAAAAAMTAATVATTTEQMLVSYQKLPLKLINFEIEINGCLNNTF